MGRGMKSVPTMTTRIATAPIASQNRPIETGTATLRLRTYRRSPWRLVIMSNASALKMYDNVLAPHLRDGVPLTDEDAG